MVIFFEIGLKLLNDSDVQREITKTDEKILLLFIEMQSDVDEQADLPLLAAKAYKKVKKQILGNDLEWLLLYNEDNYMRSIS